MPKVLKLFGSSFGVIGLCAMICAADAADPARAARGATGRNGTSGATTARMPTMPTLPMNALGNLSLNTGNTGTAVAPVVPVNPTPTPVPNPDPNPNPNPDPDPDPVPEPTPECPDGGVRNTDYTIDQCMNDLLACINNGALPNGLNDMFDEDVRNAVVNGMGLCASQVDRCRTVRQDCRYIYNASSNVWIDFNARKVQPEYYAFVIRRTGLTPNQAENTCWLLDKNTYGASFSAVANSDATTSEYNQRVGAYNGQQNNTLSKANPMGVTVNNGNSGVDGQRGHYARWDAKNADCLIRVAAYNKNDLIKNSWLFGAAGDDTPAEVWKNAGETFTCNKDLFDFSLLNNTHTAAVVGIGGGTLLGAGIGALAGHGKRAFDCTNAKHREMLTTELRGKYAVVSEYFTDSSAAIPSSVGTAMSVESCQAVLDVYDRYAELQSAVSSCVENLDKVTIKTRIEETKNTCSNDTTSVIIAQASMNLNGKTLNLGEYSSDLGANFDICNAPQEASDWADKVAEKISQDESLMSQINRGCYFKPFNRAIANGEGIYCTSATGCLTKAAIQPELNKLKPVFTQSVIDLFNNGEKGNRLKTTAIGAGIGAGTGGIVTAITAFVETNNINCRVGDGLNQVGYKKSHTIDTLKDFYVKWNLHLPDTIAPTAEVTDCASWQYACATLTDLNQCAAATINYRPAGGNSLSHVFTACRASGSVCIANDTLSEYQTLCPAANQ